MIAPFYALPHSVTQYVALLVLPLHSDMPLKPDT